MNDWPKPAGKQNPTEIVSVLMTERMAREFERRMLTPILELAGPLLFSEDDSPTYIIGSKRP